MSLPRLRQAVLVAHDLAKVSAELETAIGVTKPFHDVGVGHFGLENAVYAIGDTFLEIVSPTQPDTAAGRHLERLGGDGGYMVMFEVDDEAALRTRLGQLGVRVIWETAHDDIVDLHLHPKDATVAIVAVDVTKPAGSWRWGGPDWTGKIPDHQPGGISGITVAAVDPAATTQRWASILGVVPTGSTTLTLDGGTQTVRVVPAPDDNAQGIIAVTVTGEFGTPGSTVTVGGVDLHTDGERS